MRRIGAKHLADGGAHAWDGAFAESGADGTYVVRTVPVGVRLAVTAHGRRWADSPTEFVALPADGRDAARDLALRRPATLEVRVSSPGPCTGRSGGSAFETNIPEGGEATVRVVAK